jgi:DNA polymerase alpha subunit B
MIAGFRGRNGAGDAFIVEEILMPTALPQAATSVEELQEHHHSSAKLNGEALQIFVAAGPYTLDNDLLFTPWHRLMDTIEKQTPDVVLFNGPFLPANHASLMDPSLAQMPQEIFEHHIAARLRALCERTARTTVILLPSIRDVVSPHVAWPQPMFDKASLKIHKRVKCLPNPCIFSINEIIFGTTTADVLRDLRAEELVVDIKSDKQSTQASSPDNMARTMRHLLHQRHFYPLFPASSASDLSLDVTHAHLAQFTDVTPDVLITPSVLTPFAKVVDATVCVNPGQAAKGAIDGRGSFATLKIVPMPQIKLQDELKRHHQSDSTDEVLRLPHVVYERARVDLLRL